MSLTSQDGRERSQPRYSWVELAGLAVLLEEYYTEEEIQEANELEGAMVTSVMGVILSGRRLMTSQGRTTRSGGLVVVETALFYKERVVVPAAGRSATLASCTEHIRGRPTCWPEHESLSGGLS